MKPPRAASRLTPCCLALAVACAAPGCDSSKSEGSPAPVNQEANKKSLQSTGDFYKQKYQSPKK